MGENVTMGQSWASENTEGEDSNGGKVIAVPSWWKLSGRGGGENHLGLLTINFIGLFWKVKLKKLNMHKKN